MYLYGAGGHAKVVIEILEVSGRKISGLIDIDPAIHQLLDYPVFLGFPSDPIDNECIISIGNNVVRKRLANELKVRFSTAMHPSAVLSSRCLVGKGTVVMAGVCVNSGAIVGDHSILNTRCSVDHDCILGNFVHLSPQVALAGNVQIGEGSHIGIGACIIQGVRIGKWCTVGAGAVIINDVPDFATVVGNPGRIVRIRTGL